MTSPASAIRRGYKDLLCTRLHTVLDPILDRNFVYFYVMHTPQCHLDGRLSFPSLRPEAGNPTRSFREDPRWANTDLQRCGVAAPPSWCTTALSNSKHCSAENNHALPTMRRRAHSRRLGLRRRKRAEKGRRFPRITLFLASKRRVTRRSCWDSCRAAVLRVLGVHVGL